MTAFDSGKRGVRAVAVSISAAMAVTMAVTTAGCGPGTTPSALNSTATAASAPTSPSAPVMPACGSVDIYYDKEMPDQHVRCVLRIDPSLSVDVSSDPAWSFSLRHDGKASQEFREPTNAIGETGVVPLLMDIDDDGTPELLVVIGRGGTGGEPMAVWRLVGEPPQFVRAGELFGQRRFYQTPEGFFGNYAHASAVAGVVQLYRWVNNKLVTVAALDTRVASVPPDPYFPRDAVRTGHTLCALNSDDYPRGARAAQTAALRDAGIDPATAQQRFCSQPWVATVYG